MPLSYSSYSVNLQNSADFPGGFMVSAIDKDENGTQKAEVR